jgi:hypothetical protein
VPLGTWALDTRVGRKKINKITAPDMDLSVDRYLIRRDGLDMVASQKPAVAYLTMKQRNNDVLCDR